MQTMMRCRSVPTTGRAHVIAPKRSPVRIAKSEGKNRPVRDVSAILRAIPHKSSRSGSFYDREALDLKSLPYREIRRPLVAAVFNVQAIKICRAMTGREIKHGPSCDGPRGVLESRRTREPVIRRRAGAPQAR
jgi:hypothetical protein